jgi:hypothetical protein
MSDSEREEIGQQISKQNWMQMIGTFGVPAVLLVWYAVYIFKPAEEQRLKMEFKNSETMAVVSQTMSMLVEQDRRREEQSKEMLRILQEQSTTLKQIMVDQKRGAWNDPPKPPNSAAAVLTQPN